MGDGLDSCLTCMLHVQAQALNFYQNWPSEVLPDPLAHFITNINAAGKVLTAEQREVVLQELAKATPKITVLLSCLAHVN